MTEQELYDTVYGKLCESKRVQLDAILQGLPRVPAWQVEAYAELAKDLDAEHLQLHIKAGTTVRIVMASRLGDLGITQDLHKQNGYEFRVIPGSGYLINGRLALTP